MATDVDSDYRNASPVTTGPAFVDISRGELHIHGMDS